MLKAANYIKPQAGLRGQIVCFNTPIISLLPHTERQSDTHTRMHIRCMKVSHGFDILPILTIWVCFDLGLWKGESFGMATKCKVNDQMIMLITVLSNKCK